MATLKAPNKYHSAYNPIFFEVYNPTGNADNYTINITSKHDGKEVSYNFTRRLPGIGIPGIGMPGIGMPGIGMPGIGMPGIGMPGIPTTRNITFDLSGAIRTLFDTKIPPMNNSVEVDNRLFAKYSCEGQTYIALNAADDSSISTGALNGSYKLLSSLPTLRQYDGYDFDVSLLFGDDVSLPFTPDAVNRVKPNAIPTTNYLLDNAGNFIQDESGNFIVIDKIEIIDTPVPRNPFYIRWINRLGGIDYWMFGNSQERLLSAKNAESLLNYHTSNNRTYNIEVEDTILIGTVGISTEEWKALSLIPLSPHIEWYNKEKNKWTTITINKSENKLNTNRSLHDIELTFNLPTTQTQFA